MLQLNQLGQVKLSQTMGTLVSHPQHRVSPRQSRALPLEPTFHQVVASVYKCLVPSARSHQTQRLSVWGLNSSLHLFVSAFGLEGGGLRWNDDEQEM